MQEDLGKLVLRLTVGGLLLFHGIHKLLNGIAPIKAMVAAHHLPDAIAYGVYLGEVSGTDPCDPRSVCARRRGADRRSTCW